MLLNARRHPAASLVLATLAVLAAGSIAFGQGGNFDGFGNLIDAQAVSPTTAAPSRSRGQAADPWGPVHTDHLSLANAAPVLLPFFNNGPVYGLYGTVLGDFWDRTQITGDWADAAPILSAAACSSTSTRRAHIKTSLPAASIPAAGSCRTRRCASTSTPAAPAGGTAA